MSSTELVAITYSPLDGTGTLCRAESAGTVVRRASDQAFSPD
jgi:hypothetical protein